MDGPVRRDGISSILVCPRRARWHGIVSAYRHADTETRTRTQRSKLVPSATAADVAADGAGFAGFAAHLDMQPSDPDVLATPDVSSLVALPWNRDVAWVACDLSCGGRPLSQSSRSALRHAQRQLQEKSGLSMKTGVELEFHLLSAEDASRLADSKDSSAKPCYQVEPLMRQYDLISELLAYMEELGWMPYQADHEDSIGQFEINWTYDDALITADRHVFYKWMVREAAARRGMVATFMPKPFTHLSGNSAHMHLSLYDAAGAEVMAGDKALGLSQTALDFCGGLLAHAPAYAAVTNPTVNSYKRINAAATISGSSWAPNMVSWTGNNRSHMIRVPDAPRFEVRLADASANAYLLPAAVMAAGQDGLARKIDPGPPSLINMYTADADTQAAFTRLPLNLLDALREFRQNQALAAGLGSEVAEGYYNLRIRQWNDFTRSMSQWEIDNTLDA